MAKEKPIKLPNPVEELSNKFNDIEPEVKSSTVPSIAVIGCGGCGINMVARLNHLAKTVSREAIDTSTANHVPSDIRFETIESYENKIIGSGGIRGENASKISEVLMSLSALKDPSDIVILVHSFSGGSGSVIGPLCAKYLASNKVPLVVVGVVDSASKLSVENSIRSLHTYQSMANNDDLYFPVYLESNKSGRMNVDNNIVNFITDLVDMLTTKEVSELDVSDKRNFLRPWMIEEGLSGVYGIDVYSTDSKIEKSSPVHATLVINETGDTVNLQTPTTRMLFSGISKSKWYVGVVGLPVNVSHTKELDKNLEHFSSIGCEKSDLEKIGSKVKKKVSSSGLVL